MAKGFCGRCEIEPVHVSKTGNPSQYCLACQRAGLRERGGYQPAERVCAACGKEYRGRGRGDRCLACRTTCATCGKDKSPGDRVHNECMACRAADKVCQACGVNPPFQNRRRCWECISSEGTYAAQSRDRMYGLSLGWYDKRLAEQHGLCEICGEAECSVNKKTGRVYPLAVDHDRSCCSGFRSCGKCVRGLICRNHNAALGMFGDDPAVLEAAAAYIRKYALSDRIVQGRC
jgi:recombination endonuclease VII